MKFKKYIIFIIAIIIIITFSAFILSFNENNQQISNINKIEDCGPFLINVPENTNLENFSLDGLKTYKDDNLEIEIVYFYTNSSLGEIGLDSIDEGIKNALIINESDFPQINNTNQTIMDNLKVFKTDEGLFDNRYIAIYNDDEIYIGVKSSNLEDSLKIINSIKFKK